MVRIIGGLYRGKKLPFPEVEGLRPTPNRIRETLFNWLMQDIKGSHCLDAFAGSGALGLEAFSRGAASLVFLERSPLVYKHLQKILTSFQNPNLSLLQKDALLYLQQHTKTFDIIFLDPPFALNCIPLCLKTLEQNPHFLSGGLVYLEAPATVEINLSLWKILRLKQAGQVIYGLLEKIK